MCTGRWWNKSSREADKSGRRPLSCGSEYHAAPGGSHSLASGRRECFVVSVDNQREVVLVFAVPLFL